MEVELHEFASLIMDIGAPRRSSLFALRGNFGNMLGFDSSTRQIGDQLKQKTALLLRAYDDQDTASLRSLGSEIEGLLLTEQTLGVIDDTQTDDLIDRLYKIMGKEEA